MTQRITPRYMHLAGAVVVALEQGTTDAPMSVEAVQNKLTVAPYYWNPDTLAFEVARQVATAGSTGGSGGSTAVDATLTSAGSTRLVGQFTLANPTTSVSLSSQATVTVGNPTTSVSLSSQHTVTVASGVILGAGSSANVLGAVAQGAGSTSLAPWYVISSAGGAGSTSVDASLTSLGATRTVGVVSQGSPAGSSADAWWVRSVTTGAAGAGSTTVDANLSSAGSTREVGTVVPGSGSSSVAPWVAEGYRFSSAQTSASTIATSAESQLVAANANRRGLIISNMSTAVELLIGFTTATVSTARANCHFLIAANGRFSIGSQVGDAGLYLGPVRGRLNSTTLAGIAAIVQYTT